MMSDQNLTVEDLYTLSTNHARSHPSNPNSGNHLAELRKQTSDQNRLYWESYKNRNERHSTISDDPEGVLKLQPPSLPSFFLWKDSTVPILKAASIRPPREFRWQDWDLPLSLKIIFMCTALLMLYHMQHNLNSYMKSVRSSVIMPQPHEKLRWAHRVALIYRGPHNRNAMWDCCWSTTQQLLIHPLETGGSRVDVFAGTHSSDLVEEMRIEMRLKAAWMLDPANDPLTTYMQTLDNFRAHCDLEGRVYDLVVVTTFDLIWKVPLASLPIKKDKFHFLWGELDKHGKGDGWRTHHRVADALHVMADQHVDPLEKVLKRVRSRDRRFGLQNADMHDLYDVLAKEIDPRNITFLIKGSCLSDSRLAPNPVYEMAGLKAAGPEDLPDSCPGTLLEIRKPTMTLEQEMHHELVLNNPMPTRRLNSQYQIANE